MERSDLRQDLINASFQEYRTRLFLKRYEIVMHLKQKREREEEIALQKRKKAAMKCIVKEDMFSHYDTLTPMQIVENQAQRIANQEEEDDTFEMSADSPLQCIAPADMFLQPPSPEETAVQAVVQAPRRLQAAQVQQLGRSS